MICFNDDKYNIRCFRSVSAFYANLFKRTENVNNQNKNNY